MQPRANTSGGWFWLLGLPHATHMAGVAFGCSNRAYGECQEEPLANLAYSYRSCGGIRREGERDYNNTTDQETDRRICWSFISWASMSSTFWLASQPKSELGECVTWNCQHPMSWFWNVLESTMSSSLVESMHGLPMFNQFYSADMIAYLQEGPRESGEGCQSWHEKATWLLSKEMRKN